MGVIAMLFTTFIQRRLVASQRFMVLGPVHSTLNPKLGVTIQPPQTYTPRV